MKHLGSFIVLGALATCALACSSGSDGGGGSSKSAVELVPGDNALPGWTVDVSISKSKSTDPITAASETEAVALIDGGAEPFYKDPFTPKMFVWQNYVNSTLPAAPPPTGAAVVLYVLQMPSAEQATGLYTALLQESEYSGQKGTPDDWKATTPTLGTESRIEDTRTAWWINFHKDVFYVEVMLSPSYGPPPNYDPGDASLKAEAMRFAEAVASKM